LKKDEYMAVFVRKERLRGSEYCSRSRATEQRVSHARKCCFIRSGLNQVGFRTLKEAKVTPPITNEPPMIGTNPMRSPNVSTAITAVNIGMRFKKIDPRAAPMPSMLTLHAMKAATEAKTPT
jgi:hypothetical protein